MRVCYSLWTQPLRCKLSNFFVSKNKVVETDLQLVKVVKLRKNNMRRWLEAVFAISPSVATLCPLFQGNLVRLIFSHSKLSISSTIYRSGFLCAGYKAILGYNGSCTALCGRIKDTTLSYILQFIYSKPQGRYLQVPIMLVRHGHVSSNLGS